MTHSTGIKSPIRSSLHVQFCRSFFTGHCAHHTNFSSNMFPTIRYVSLCICFIAVFQVCLHQNNYSFVSIIFFFQFSAADNFLCLQTPFFLAPVQPCFGSINWITYAGQANQARKTLCQKIANPLYSANVRKSASNILNNINEMNGAAKRIAAGIANQCQQKNERCLAAKIVIEDLEERIRCFVSTLRSVS